MLLNASEIISQSFSIYKKNWRELAVYAALLFLPSAVLVVLGVLGTYLVIYSPKLSLVTNLVIVAIYAAGLVFTLWTTMALSLKIKNLLDHKTGEKWPVLFSLTSPLIWPIFYTSILVGLIVFGGTLLLIVPGIIFAVWYAFYFYFVLFEKQKGMAALRESKKLVTGRWGIMLWLMVLPLFLYSLSAMILQYIITTPLSILISNDITELIVNSTINSIVNSVMAPFSIAAMVILYLSAKNNPVPTPEPILPKEQ